MQWAVVPIIPALQFWQPVSTVFYLAVTSSTKRLNFWTNCLIKGGPTDSPTALQAVVQRLRNDKTIRIITIGIGEAKESELASISGNPAYVFMIDDYSDLQSVVPDILNLICEIDEEFKSL